MGVRSDQRPEGAGRQCERRQRPPWWEPEQILARLQSGEYVGNLCQRASEQTDGYLSARTLRGDISAWANSARWGEQFTKALSLLHKDNRGLLLVSKDWHAEFFYAMSENGGNGEAAAEACGVGYGIVLAIMDRRNRVYDQDFTERYRIAEADRVGRIRSQYMEYAENGLDDRTRIGVQEKVLAANLPALHSTKQEMIVSGKVEHEHSGTVGLSVEVLAASRARTNGLLSSRRVAVQEELIAAHRQPAGLLAEDGAAGSGIVIDVTPQRQRETTQAQTDHR